ncbi:hypothetical protein Q2K19_26530 [Micromonospora soli]|uniref:hypothetical protein n=1 Tax=Micromonospora sp. NBRC 110009 TaxID=3061627 RepID=UPI002671FD8F|nr:hypothetical protein [Micromonospora sp. NBRC 110009]WKT97700.1 hypothetical protein Q2K19_26530 [Micromonospora sp. NBRC 110009]
MSVPTPPRSAGFPQDRRAALPQERPDAADCGTAVGPAATAPDSPAAARLDGRAAAALMLGGAGMFVFNILFGPLAIVLGLRAARDPRGGRFGRLGGRLGAFLGVLDLAILAVLLISRLSRHGLTWQFGA